MSSHSGGSGASARETYGSSQNQYDDAWWKYVKSLEDRMQQMEEQHSAAVARLQSEHSHLETERQTRIVQLEKDNKELKDEIATLKAQLANAVNA
jgi:DNA repair exonuclease SbcCD ATPase subunit